MKKASLLTIFSAALILAACGGGGESSTGTSGTTSTSTSTGTGSSTGSSSSTGTTSSSGSPKDPVKEYYRAMDLVGEAAENFKSHERTFTGLEHFSETQSYKVVMTDTEGAETVLADEADENEQWYKYSHDAVNKVGVSAKDETSMEGEREFAWQIWVQKEEDGNYYEYDTDYRVDYRVDDGYSWNAIICNGSELSYQQLDEYALHEYESFPYELDLLMKRERAERGDECVGEATPIRGLEVSIVEGALETVIKVGVSISSVYVAPTLPEDLGDKSYLMENSIEWNFTCEIHLNELGMTSIEVDETTVQLAAERTKDGELKSFNTEFKSRSIEYSDAYSAPAAIDTSEYEYCGVKRSSIDFYRPSGEYVNGMYAEAGTAFHPEQDDILDADIIAQGITAELYWDKDYTKPVDFENAQFKSYSQAMYIKYIVPSDISYVIWSTYAEWFPYAPARALMAKGAEFVALADAGHYAIDGYLVMNPKDPDGVTHPCVYVYPTEASIIYTTDGSASLTEGLYLDLKGGCMYEMRYTCAYEDA